MKTLPLCNGLTIYKNRPAGQAAKKSIVMIKQVNLTISPFFSGNHYGTPKPSKDSVRPDHGLAPSLSSNSGTGSSSGNQTNISGGNGNIGNVNFPGAHPSSEGKRRRNRSNVEAMTAKHLQNETDDVTTETNNKDDLNHGE